jgi:hypothetical protein
MGQSRQRVKTLIARAGVTAVTVTLAGAVMGSIAGADAGAAAVAAVAATAIAATRCEAGIVAGAVAGAAAAIGANGIVTFVTFSPVNCKQYDEGFWGKNQQKFHASKAGYPLSLHAQTR